VKRTQEASERAIRKSLISPKVRLPKKQIKLEHDKGAGTVTSLSTTLATRRKREKSSDWRECRVYANANGIHNDNHGNVMFKLRKLLLCTSEHKLASPCVGGGRSLSKKSFRDRDNKMKFLFSYIKLHSNSINKFRFGSFQLVLLVLPLFRIL
jgi:hypothetical protein